MYICRVFENSCYMFWVFIPTVNVCTMSFRTPCIYNLYVCVALLLKTFNTCLVMQLYK